MQEKHVMGKNRFESQIDLKDVSSNMRILKHEDVTLLLYELNSEGKIFARLKGTLNEFLIPWDFFQANFKPIK